LSCPLPDLPYFLRITPPPSSTLFPYTTLFRSPINVSSAACAWHAANSMLFLSAKILFTMEEKQITLQIDGHFITVPEGSTILEADRKSTRLNSSHVSISYAVFCLKKKKKIITI